MRTISIHYTVQKLPQITSKIYQLVTKKETMSINSNERSRPPSRKEIVENNSYFVALKTRNLQIRNRSTHRNTSNRKTEHHSIPHKGCSSGPKLGNYSDRGF